jgi:hypothetical protein
MFSFYLFSFVKLENRKAEQVLPREGMVDTSTWGVGRGRRINVVQKMCIHACKCKNSAC